MTAKNLISYTEKMLDLPETRKDFPGASPRTVLPLGIRRFSGIMRTILKAIKAYLDRLGHQRV